MSYKLKAGEKIPRAVRRIARERIDRALKRLGQKPASEAVHEARKDLKKLRSLLRLARTGMGRRVCREEDKKFREAGRTLAPMRDAEVLLKTLEKLRCCCQGKTARQAFGRLRAILARRTRSARRKGADFREVKAELKAARRHVEDWPLEKTGWGDLCRGIRRSYKRAAQAFRKVERGPSPETMHEWRKRTKDVWHQLRLLKPMQPQALGKLADEMKRLEENLGDAHDLAMLEAAATRLKLQGKEFELVARPIETRRIKLQSAALEQGRRLYLQKPGAFARRIEHYARKWRGL